MANFTNPFFRRDQIAANQAPNWEEDSFGAACLSASAPCSQGNVPLYGILVSSDADVAAGLEFAQTYNIRVVIKSSGHDFQGRSSGKDSLLLWTRQLKGISLTETFAACSGDAPLPSVTTTPGSGWGDVYSAVQTFVSPGKYYVVGGSSRTVSSAGGYTLGGGHGFAGPMSGLAVDNVLRFTAVLADGSSVVASKCQNPDLFWALRGGGGSFAVVTSATYKLHLTPSTGVTGWSLVVAMLQGTTSSTILLDAFLSLAPSMVNASAGFPGQGVWGGYFFFGAPSTGAYAAFSLVYNGTSSTATLITQQAIDFLRSQPFHFLVLENTLTSYPSFFAWKDATAPANTTDQTGTSVTMGSRLIPAAASLNETLRAQTARVLIQGMTMTGALTLYGHVVLGGTTSQLDPNSLETSVTPAWRNSLWHVAYADGWELGAGVASQQAAFARVTAATQLLRDLFPNSGCYFNEADYNEPNWPVAFWGVANYARLRDIKGRYDPTGLLTCHHCVDTPPAAPSASPSSSPSVGAIPSVTMTPAPLATSGAAQTGAPSIAMSTGTMVGIVLIFVVIGGFIAAGAYAVNSRKNKPLMLVPKVVPVAPIDP